MAAKSLDKSITEQIIIDWRLGQMSQRQIAAKHKVSNGIVAKITKGVEQDVAPIVSGGIAYNQSLMGHDERIVSAVEETVSTAVKRMEWLNQQALKNVKLAMAHDCESQNDFRARADTISKAKDVVFGKSPETSIQVNGKADGIHIYGGLVEDGGAVIDADTAGTIKI